MLVPSLSPEIVLTEIIEPLIHLAADPIPNIRFNVAKSFEVIGTAFGSSSPEAKTLIQGIVPVLEKLRNDTDADVRYFASHALEKVEGKA